MSHRRRATFALLLALAACSADRSSDGLPATSTTGGVGASVTSVSGPRFGSATIEPAVAAAGDRVIVTPSAEIQPICGALAVVLTADERHDPVLQLSDGRVVLYGGDTMVTWPACLPPRSSARATFAIAADFPLGTHVVCLTSEFTEEGCATLIVVADATG